MSDQAVRRRPAAAPTTPEIFMKVAAPKVSEPAPVDGFTGFAASGSGRHTVLAV